MHDPRDPKGKDLKTVLPLLAAATLPAAGCDEDLPPSQQDPEAIVHEATASDLAGTTFGEAAKRVLTKRPDGSVEVSLDVLSEVMGSPQNTPDPQSEVKRYTVREGDTLSAIAQRELGSASRWKEIQAANGGLDPGRLQIGASLIIPGKDVEKAGQSRDIGGTSGHAEQIEPAGSKEVRVTTAKDVPQNIRDFIKENRELALEVQEIYGVPADTTLVMSMMETGMGTRFAARNNFFNIKDSPTDSWHGPSVSRDVEEEDRRGKRYIERGASFRAYGSKRESFLDFGRFVSEHPGFRLALRPGRSGRDTLHEIIQRGYATDKSYVENTDSLFGYFAQPGEVDSHPLKEGFKTAFIEKGDKFGFSSVSKRLYGTAKYASAIAKANPDRDPRRLRAGMKIYVPDLSQVSKEQPPEKTIPEKTAPAGFTAYTVKAGDTLSEIAETLCGSARAWKAIAKANPGLNPDRIRVGEEIYIPDNLLKK